MAGTVTGIVVLAKENGYARWSVVRAYTDQDRINLLGQLAYVTNNLVNMQEASEE